MADQPQRPVGYDDTPYISGCKWRVHDGARPQARVVTPPTASTEDAPGAPPSDAVVLFNGSDLSGWASSKDGSDAAWKVEDGYMEVVPKTGNISSKECLGDCQLHVEWAAPEVVLSDSQGRGNSGVFLMETYEIQVLDNYDNPTYADGTCGGIYGQYPPLVNACRKPGVWQTYDIIWRGPRFDGEKLIRPAYLTVIQNGILLHLDKELLGPTQHRITTYYKPQATTGPLMLQDHGDLVRFRNIWFRPLTGYDES